MYSLFLCFLFIFLVFGFWDYGIIRVISILPSAKYDEELDPVCSTRWLIRRVIFNIYSCHYLVASKRSAGACYYIAPCCKSTKQGSHH